MWQLKTAHRGDAWTKLGEFDTVAAAARKIIELEAYPVTALFFDMLVDTKSSTDDEAFSYLEHTGLTTERCYLIKHLLR
jgi:hypothetical protein